MLNNIIFEDFNPLKKTHYNDKLLYVIIIL